MMLAAVPETALVEQYGVMGIFAVLAYQQLSNIYKAVKERGERGPKEMRELLVDELRKINTSLTDMTRMQKGIDHDWGAMRAEVKELYDWHKPTPGNGFSWAVKKDIKELRTKINELQESLRTRN